MKFHFSGFFRENTPKLLRFIKIYSRPMKFLTYLRNYKKAFYQEPV